MSEERILYGQKQTDVVGIQKRVIQLAKEIATRDDGPDLRELFNAVFFNLRGVATPCPKESLRRLGEQMAEHPDRAALWADFEEHYRETAANKRDKEIVRSGKFEKV